MKIKKQLTTYILHGGKTSEKNERNKQFFEAIFKHVNKDKLHILVVYYARWWKRDEWPLLLKEDQAEFEKFKINNIKISFELASENVDEVLTQINKADVILIKGGDTQKLLLKLKKIKNFVKIIKGKLLVGSSAGALIFSSYYYSNDNKKVGKGLGILPLKMFVHYSVECTKELQELNSVHSKLPIVAIPECDFTIILH